ncbi:MAG: fumarylacetoacetate hydrolase family protein [Thermoanaerobaculia bacterium]
MKIYRFLHNGRPAVGLADGEHLFRHDGDALHLGARVDEPPHLVASVQLLPPVEPSKIVAVGRNYADHAKELGNDTPAEPILFLKPPSALCASGAEIALPAMSERVEHEAEIGVVVGSRLKDASSAEARRGVYAITCVNDVTARDLQKKDVQFTRGKGFDTFAPLGPCIETDFDPSDARLTTRVNGETRQDGRTSQMIFALDWLFEYITAIMTLVPGDVILTGTPSGVGPLQAGDVVEVEVEGIGVLSNAVA